MEKNMEFMQIAMKYLPEAQAQLQESGVDFSPELAQPFFEMFLKVMQEAYDLGKQDALLDE
ncbi:ComZ family protein [Domibacillus enclensis]|uniref:Competence protein ComG n=1 Tax=Domibacillus enclensis TaxID=1017273 RepID=A0A1N7AXF0_9BACI|nr:ComZ family protein [Domibacillus enclensis]OXS75116.1 competence protein ComG [Domibacillus enclensis]SIR43746.1 competence protein ComZ [Domibacillus enclensis]